MPPARAWQGGRKLPSHTLALGRPGGREQPGCTAGKIDRLTCFGPCQCLLMTRAFNPLVASLNLVEPARIQALQL